MQFELKKLSRIWGSAYFRHSRPGQALSMSDRVAVFNNGKIEQIDTPRNSAPARLLWRALSARLMFLTTGARARCVR
jgi:ABC-type Fe3+/spermidine/putrescine transport system ATPase subunit